MARWYAEYARPNLSGELSQICGSDGMTSIDGRLARWRAWNTACERVGLIPPGARPTHGRLVRAEVYRNVGEATPDQWVKLPGWAIDQRRTEGSA